METKVGTKYVLPGETRKRKTSDVAWTTAWAILLIGWITFLIVSSIAKDFWSLPLKEIFLLLIICNIPTIIFATGFGFMITHSNRVRTLEFKIHKYERWNKEYNKYETFYCTSNSALIEKYIYYKYIGDVVVEKSPEELTKYLTEHDNDWHKLISFKTQEDAMRDILKSIKNFISHERAEENIKIRNISTLEIFSVKELKEKLNNNEYDELLKSKD